MASTPLPLCPACSEAAESAGARFCEACGSPMSAELGYADPSPALAPSACQSCGADPLELDPEGYCRECGMRPRSSQPGKTAAERGQGLRASFALDPRLACASDVGRRHRVNQDASCVGREGEWALLAVSDGVSSAQLSELASMACVEAWLAAARLALDAGHGPESAMREGMSAAHRAALAIPYDPLDRAGLDEPEATLVAAIAKPGEAWLGWVGDSRGYAIAADGSAGRQLTRDDSWMRMAIDEGMDPAAAEADPRAHAITQCMGTRDEDPSPHVERFELAAGEGALLCSDGLWNYHSEPGDIAPSVAAHPGDALGACVELNARANASGGRDNITVAIWLP